MASSIFKWWLLPSFCAKKYADPWVIQKEVLRGTSSLKKNLPGIHWRRKLKLQLAAGVKWQKNDRTSDKSKHIIWSRKEGEEPIWKSLFKNFLSWLFWQKITPLSQVEEKNKVMRRKLRLSMSINYWMSTEVVATGCGSSLIAASFKEVSNHRLLLRLCFKLPHKTISLKFIWSNIICSY